MLLVGAGNSGSEIALEVDNARVRAGQIAKIEKVRAGRDEAKVRAALFTKVTALALKLEAKVKERGFETLEHDALAIHMRKGKDASPRSCEGDRDCLDRESHLASATSLSVQTALRGDGPALSTRP